MKATLLALLGVFVLSGCAASPAAPSPDVPVGGGSIVSGTVYTVDATGRRPLEGAMVELADSSSAAAWGKYGNPTTDAAGRYVSGSLQPLHYLARASKTGYTGSAVVSLGYLEASRTLDFELTTPAAAAPLSITAISPSTGSIGGGTTVRITGTGFQSGATVTFDGYPSTNYLENSTTIQSTTPVHAAGTVDVVVTNPGGGAVRLTGAYIYASPQSFDFNGTWVGYALSHPETGTRFRGFHSDMEMRFTIQSYSLTSVTCGTSAVLTFSPPPSVSNGEFSFVGVGVSISGRIVSAVGAVGTISTAPCPATRWAATRQ